MEQMHYKIVSGLNANVRLGNINEANVYYKIHTSFTVECNKYTIEVVEYKKACSKRGGDNVFV